MSSTTGEESRWNRPSQGIQAVISTRDGSKTWQNTNQFQAWLSPTGKYVVYHDGKQRSYFSYEIESGRVRNITRDVSAMWWSNRTAAEGVPNQRNSAKGVAGWVKGDTAVLIYDRNDIWLVDPAAKTPPVNVTNGYGRRHNIVLELALDYSDKSVTSDEQLILVAVNRTTKANGFYSTIIGQRGDPILLTMGAYVYDLRDVVTPAGASFRPLKAIQADTYIVRRASAADAPNFFATTDFKTFNRLSDLHPEREYNWLTTELHTWRTVAGVQLQGILYRPENFDATKTYPVIFNYYDMKSDGLNAYLRPGPSECEINIPMYVSNGYLVFTPDIHYKIGHPGESAVESIVSAAKYLATMPWVDPSRMGIQGCSFAAFETNYLVTHTNVFAAAVSAAGLSDLISAYGALYESGASKQEQIEGGQYRLGASLWEEPELYVENSPVLRAGQVVTPLLMMHNRKDPVCPFANAVEFFTALRRLGKKAWMLQYDDGRHTLEGKSAVDFSMRMAQFFDYYLKGAPPPKWMTEGVPARLKGIETGLELDTSGREPGPGLVQEESTSQAASIGKRRSCGVSTPASSRSIPCSRESSRPILSHDTENNSTHSQGEIQRVN